MDENYYLKQTKLIFTMKIFILIFILISFTACDLIQSLDPKVKKSKSGICHKKGTQYYNQTTKYISFETIQNCINSGGRLPR